MPLILSANSVSGYNVANSLRFNPGSSDYLSRNPASAGNRRTFTWSGWLKYCVSSNYSVIFSALNGTNTDQDALYLDQTSPALTVQFDGVGTALRTTQLFRDPSAWYHIILAVDTTQATASNRLKLYVNGVQVTSFTTANYPTLNQQANGWNTTNPHYHGVQAQALVATNTLLNGYLAEVNFIDGQALTPSSFGETNTLSGIWIPKAYTGTYGTNGFYLKFANSASLGTDSSGNGNNFTVNNLTSVDQSTDTPTNNFGTFNSIKFTVGTLTEGNLQLDSSSASWKTRNSTIGVSSGKWFVEFKMGSITADQSAISIVSDLTPDGNCPASVAGTSPAIAYNSDGRKLVNGGATSSYFSAMSSNDIIGVALDMNGGTVQFYRNGSTTGSAINLSDAFASSDYPLFFAGSVYNTRNVQANFGSPSYSANSYTDGAGYGNFSYAVPSGYYALNTKNLANFG